MSDKNVKEKLLTGMKVGDKTFKNHLDGYNFMSFFKGEVAEGPRKEFFYFDDNRNLNALRYGPLENPILVDRRQSIHWQAHEHERTAGH